VTTRTRKRKTKKTKKTTRKTTAKKTKKTTATTKKTKKTTKKTKPVTKRTAKLVGGKWKIKAKAKPKATNKPRKAASKPKAKPRAAKPKARKGRKVKPKATRKAKPRAPRIPRGFELVPGQVDARVKIKERLDATKATLDLIELESRVYVHEYENGQVDGEIAVTVPRGKTALEVDQELEQAFQTLPLGLGRGYWFGLGVRIGFNKEIDEERSGSARVRGMDDLQMYYRRVNTPNMIDSFLREQMIMIPGAEDRFKRKIEIVYIRLHWNPENEKPSR